jgi:hypothetical protein
MKNSKRRPRSSGVCRGAGERDVQYEIKMFLSALGSYPDRFAREPSLSFEQHLFRVVATSHVASGGERRHS